LRIPVLIAGAGDDGTKQPASEQPPALIWIGLPIGENRLETMSRQNFVSNVPASSSSWAVLCDSIKKKVNYT
jgi:hypothetical protein